MIFCSCKNISTDQIRQRFIETGSMQQTLIDLQIGTTCGVCLSRLDLVREIEEDILKGRIAQRSAASGS